MNLKCEYQGTKCMRYQLSLQRFTMRQKRIYHAVCFILVGLLEVSCFTNAARADQKDSLRNELNKATLTNTSRAKILEQIVLSTMDAHPDTAVHYAWQIYHIAQQDSANKNLLAEALTALVNGYQNYDKSDKVLAYGFQLLKLSEEMGDTARMGRALFAIGHASGQLSTKNIHSENNSALHYLQQALAIANTTNDNRLTTECLNAIGRIYRKEQQFDTAKVYHERALVLARKHHFPFQKAWALNSLATCYENKGDIRAALEYALASLTSYEADSIGTIIAIPLNNIARLYQKLGNLPQALAYAKRSFLFAQKSQNRAALYMSCERIALIFEEIGDYRNALVYQKRFVVIRDSVALLERTEDLSGLQSSLDYAYNKREKELHLREDEALKLAVQKQQIIIALIAIGCSLLALATFLLLRSLRSAKLLNVQLQTATTERNTIGEELHERGQHLETIIASLDDIIFEFDDTFHFLNVWCADASKLFFPPKQFLGKTIRETFGEEFAHIFESAILESFESGNVQRIEYTTPFATEQNSRWFEGKIVPIKTEEGEQRRAALQVSDITERKEREQELQLIYNAVNRSSDAISIIQARTGNLVFANDRLCTNLFRTREELLQTPVQQLETIFEQPGAWESHVEEMRNKKNAVVQGVQKRKDGYTFPVEVSVSLIEIGKEEFEVVITRDITERKKAEEQTLAQSRFIRSVTDAIPGMLSYWTTNLRCTFANASYVECFGKTLHEIIGIELQELLGDTRFKLKESYIQGALKGQSQQCEREILDKNGETQFSLVQFIPDISEDRVLGFIILETDITSTKKVQNSLKEAQRLAHIGSWEWDITLNTLTWSDEQYHIFGEDIHSHQPTFETYFSHFTEEEQKRTASLLHEAISGAETYSIEHEITRPDGSCLFVFEQANVVYDYAKKPIRMLGTTQDITQRKRSEEELQKLSLVASKTTNAVVMTDEYGNIEWVNEGFTSLTEYSIEEVFGKKPGQFLKGHNTDALTIQMINEAIRCGKGFEAELLHYTKNQKPLWLHIKADPIINSDGKLTGFIAIQTNITERKRAEEQQFQKLSLVASKTTNGVVITDPNGAITWVNEGFTAITEFSLDEVIGKIPEQFTQTYQNAPDVLSRLNKALQQGKGIDIEVAQLSKSGRQYWVHLKTDPFYDEQSFLGGYIVIINDISERKKAEQLLFESEERYRLIFEHSSEGVLQTLPDGTIETANPEACHILGRTKDELSRLNRADIVDLTDARLSLFRKERREKGFVKGELNFVRKDGTIFPGEFSSTLYKDTNGSEHIAVFLRDVSERKAAENAIRKSEARLSTALQSLSEGILIYENGLESQTMNASALRILGLSKEQINQQAPLDEGWRSVHEDGSDFPFAEYPLMMTLKSGKPQSNVIMGVHKADGTQTWISINSRPLVVEGATELSGVVVSFTDITERRRKEQELLESEERYRLIFENTSEGIMQSLSDGTIEVANPQACRMLGRSMEELCQMNRKDIVDKNDPRIAAIAEEQEKKGFVKGELNFLRSDGTTFPGEFSVAKFTDTKGILHNAVFLKDVSERKKAEDAIRKNEAWLSTSLQALSEGIMIIDLQSETRICNKSAELITGLTAEQINFQVPIDPQWKTIHEDGSLFLQHEQPSMITLNTGQPQSNVIMGIQKPNGTTTWISANSRPINLLDNSEYSGAVISFRDITEQKKAEKKLRFQTQLLNSIILSMSDGVVLVDEHRSIVLVNPAVEALFGYNKESLLSQPLSMLIPNTAHEKHIQAFLQNEKSIPFHRMEGVHGQRSGGEIFSIELSIAQFNVDGKLFTLATVRDITQRLEAEEEILQLNRTLTQRVEERTADLVRLNKEKDDFLGIAAHDLKNPLAAIRTSAQIIEECFKDGEEIDFAEYADSIIATADEMLEIITNFLDIELIENGKLGLALERISLEIIGMTVESHRKRAAAKGITIHYEEPSSALFLITDKLALKQVLNNLLSNAVKFSPKGKNIVVQVTELRERSTEQQHGSPYHHVLRIAIHDEGPGISAAEQANLFVKFARLSAKPTAEEGSTGLGLSIVKRLIEMMNGQVWCESKEGKGSTFIVELPIV